MAISINQMPSIPAQTHWKTSTLPPGNNHFVLLIAGYAINNNLLDIIMIMAACTKN